MDKYKNKKTNGLSVISVVLLIIGIMILIVYIQKSNDNYNRIKEYKNQHIVYSRIEIPDSTYPKYVPYINIKSEDVTNANSEIESLINPYLGNKDTIVSYEYNVSGIYLSVVIKVEDYSVNNGPKVNFNTYIINLKNQRLVSNKEVIELFNTNEDEVSRIIEYEFNNYYEDLVNEEYYKSIRCDYSCFLKHREVSNYLDDIHYYIRNGDLVVFKPFIFYSSLNDGDYFEPTNYEFIIVETNKK